jgi:hypothetical protein
VDSFLTLVAFAVAASIGLLLAGKRRQKRHDAWRLAARKVGLTEVRLEEGGVFGKGTLLGRSGDLHLRLEVYAAGDSESGTKIVVAGLGDGAGGLSLRREGLSTALERRVVGEREVRIGDPPFDDEYYVQGEAALVLALLDADTRAALAALMRNWVATPRESVKVGTSLNDGVLEVRVQDGAFSRNLQRLPDVLAAVVEVTRRLVAPADLAARIAGNLRAEPEAGVRLQCLTTLARDFPDDPATREALLRAREDPDAEVRLRAGTVLGSEGRDVLRAIAAGEGAADETTERAVAALEPALTVEEAMELLRNALRTRRIATAKACMVAVGRRGGTEAVALLARALAVETGELAWAASRALAITRDPLPRSLSCGRWRAARGICGSRRPRRSVTWARPRPSRRCGRRSRATPRCAEPSARRSRRSSRGSRAPRRGSCRSPAGSPANCRSPR